MMCYIFNVRKSSFVSKRDGNKKKDGWNVSLVCLEGSKFHLETFIDQKDDVFTKTSDCDLSKAFSAGFFDVDIYEFESKNENGISIYQKRIIKILARKTLKDAEAFL